MDSIVLSLGSNIGQRSDNLAKARDLLSDRGIRICQKSRIYETETFGGPIGQADHFNQVLVVETDKSPSELLKTCLEIESKMGRIRSVKNGPRPIDIDILFYHDEIIDTEKLSIPHRGLHERRFVLEPLSDILPKSIHPKLKKSIQEILDSCPDTLRVQCLEDNGNFTEDIFRSWIRSYGDDPHREGLQDSYYRFIESRRELFAGYHQDPKSLITLFDSEGYDEMIISQNNDFFSTCEHHLLPFYGRAHIGYIPGEKIIGLSKFARIIDVFARRMQNQERLTRLIADFLWTTLRPKGLGVILDAQHLCIKARGVGKQNALVTTSAFKGLFKKCPETRAEFLVLITKS